MCSTLADRAPCQTARLLVLVLAAVLLAPRMPGPLRHWDEAWYAQASREMLHASQQAQTLRQRFASLLTVRWNYSEWFHKPPLAFWATAAAFRMFGESELAARLFSYLCALATVGILAAFAGRNISPKAGILAALLLLCIPEFCRYATRGQLDAPLTLWMTLNLVSFWLGQDKPRWHWLGGAALGLAMMTKGAAAGLALIVQASYVAFSGDRRCLRQKSWWGALLLSGLIAVPWHVYQWRMFGERFLDEYGSRHFTQFFSDIYPEVDRAASPLYYLEFLLRKEAAWSWGVLVVAAAGIRVAWRTRELLIVFACFWTLAMPLALSLAWAKSSWYLVPMYPGAALLGVLILERSRLWQRQSTLVIALAVVGSLVCSAEPLWTPVCKEHEEAIRALAPRVQRLLPITAPLHTLQVPRAADSIYPIATLFYCQRPVRAVHGLEHLSAIARRSKSVFYVLVHWSQLKAIEQEGQADRIGGKTGPAAGFAIEYAGRAGPVVLVRVVPGAIAEQLKGLARKRSQQTLDQ